ncbi:MAG: hypothetical protein RMI43_04165 [Candidatus Caldarchaeum sp.]|nr:hypothetical protein [Candidatus Caldarchaeum sp.]
MSASGDDVLNTAAEQLDYCEKMLAMEARLDLVIMMLEELIEKLSSPRQGVDDEKRTSLLEKAKVCYYRAKTLQYLTETTRGAKY